MVKDFGVIVGIFVVEVIFKKVDLEVVIDIKIFDGIVVSVGDIVFIVECNF